MPFSTLTDQRMWTDRLTDYVHAVEKMVDDEPVTGLEARRLADMLQESTFGSNERDDLYDLIDEHEEAADTDDLAAFTIPADAIRDVAPFMPDGKSASDMMRKVTSFQRKSVAAYFEGPYQGMDSDRVRLGTIHSAKGREADHVFVSTDLTEKVVEQMAASVSEEELEAKGIDGFTSTTTPVPILTDNERRVFYVGMSRARERLVILENLVDGAPTLPVSVLLHNELREESLDELLETAQEPVAPEP
jgi:DNA helicase-2/ATP-dependent DNA helicase PcrA